MTMTTSVRDLVRSECLRDENPFGAAFFEEHLQLVVSYGTRLAARLGADPEVVELAGWLHDLAAVRDLAAVPTHPRDGARIAREILSALGAPSRVVDGVCRCIASHSAPVALGAGAPEEVCVSNADVMSHLARPAYWFFYLFRVRGLAFRDGTAWLRARADQAWSALVDDARSMIAAERARAVCLVELPPMPAPAIRRGAPGFTSLGSGE